MSGAEIASAFRRQAARPVRRTRRAAEAHGFDVVSVFADLLDSRAAGAAGDGADHLPGPARRGLPQPVHPAPVRDRRRLAALDAVCGGRAYLGLAAGVARAIGIEQRRPLDHCATPRRSCARCCPATSAATPARVPAGGGVRLRYPFRVACRRCCRHLGCARGALAGEIADEVKVGGSANRRWCR